MSNEQPTTITQAVAVNPPAKPGDDIDFGPFFSYLQSVQGHEVVTRILGMVEDVKKLALEKHVDQVKHNRWLEASVIVFVVGAICILSALDKLTTPAGIALGTIVGYFFARTK